MDEENIGDAGGQEELLASIRCLARIVLGKMEEGSRAKTLDAAQLRLLGGIALRVLRLWRQSLPEQGRLGHSAARLQNLQQELKKLSAGKTREEVMAGTEAAGS